MLQLSPSRVTDNPLLLRCSPDMLNWTLELDTMVVGETLLTLAVGDKLTTSPSPPPPPPPPPQEESHRDNNAMKHTHHVTLARQTRPEWACGIMKE